MVAISGPQLRAARGMLDWTREILAKEAGISQETVKNIEHGVFRPQESTTDAIVKAFAIRDVVFTDNEGVQIKKDSVIRYEGVEGFKKFMDDVYNTAKHLAELGEKAQPICVSCISDKDFIKYLGDYFDGHIRRMNALSKLKMQILHKELPGSIQLEEVRGGSYREYRLRSQHDTANASFYIYGKKFAILAFEAENPPQITVITSELVQRAQREQFEALWSNAKPCVVVSKAKHS